MDKYWFKSGAHLDIQGISIYPNTSARVQALVFYGEGTIQNRFVDILAGDEYNNWGNDDDYIIALVAFKLGLGERIQPFSNDPDCIPKPFNSYDFTSGILLSATAPSLSAIASQVYHDDTRSVHNDADIAKIQTLEEQMVEQTRQLQQMRQIMISKGMI
jgi:hypothetical protein